MNKKRAFTLIELMIVITIISIISLATYMPYAHHQKKTLIKQAAREITQSLSEARNLAVNWLSTASWANLHVGLFFASWATQIDYYTSTWVLDIVSLPAEVYKTKKLPSWMQIDSIDGESGEQLISFSAISWSWYLSNIAFSWAIDIDISYKWATSDVLQKTITYYTKSFISDY